MLTEDSASPGRQTNFGFSIKHQYKFKGKLPEPRRWSCQMQFWSRRRSFNAPLSFTHEKHQHVWHSHPVLPPEAPHAAGRGGISTLIPLCFSKGGIMIAKPDSSLCLLPPSPGFLHRSTLHRNLREYCMSRLGDSPEFKTIAFLVPLLSHFPVGASCQPGNKCHMCFLCTASQGDLFVSVMIEGFLFVSTCVCARRLVKLGQGVHNEHIYSWEYNEMREEMIY